MRSRVEVLITNHLRDFASDLENYKAVQVFLMLEDRNQKGFIFFRLFYSSNRNYYEFLKPKVGPIILPIA